MGESVDRLEPLSDQLLSVVLDVDADRCAHQIVQLSTLSLLVDAGLVSAEQAIERIRLVAQTLTHQHLAEDVDRRIERLAELLGGSGRRRTQAWKPKVIRGGRAGD